MISYRDMTFCSFHEECDKGDNCFRALNEEVVDNAKNAGLLICQFMDKPECFTTKEES